MNNDKTSPVAPEQIVADLAHELYAMAQGPQPIEDAVAAIAKRLASFEAAPAAPLLMQDENSGRDGHRYNEWHASRPDARLNAREAAEAMAVQGEDWWCDLASRHATADWNCDQPDGYLNAVKALVEDALASTAATPAAPSAGVAEAAELLAVAEFLGGAKDRLGRPDASANDQMRSSRAAIQRAAIRHGVAGGHHTYLDQCAAVLRAIAGSRK